MGNIFKMSNRFFIAGTLILLIGAGLVLAELYNTSQAVNALTFQKDIITALQRLPDGKYHGEYTASKLLGARVEITVQDGRIQEIKLLEHTNGRGKSAETLPEQVVREQSLDIDLVSGATMSSKTILKAIESALTK